MRTAVTKGIKIIVETYYQKEYSSPMNNEYMFAYKVSISNESTQTIKLLRRHWHIIDSTQQTREVEGEGVVGNQPIIYPGETFQYVSGCNLKSEMGKMYGTYTMQRVSDGQLFEVTIPAFELIADSKLN
jgi:ApaG protein